MDDILLAFVRENMITISFILACLKVIAIETETVVDDKILQLLSGLVSNIRGKK